MDGQPPNSGHPAGIGRRWSGGPLFPGRCSQRAGGERDRRSYVRQSIGPLGGLIHGAGVLQDRRIADKRPEQFEKVYDTKVSGLINCLAATENDNLKYVVLFSSVSARMGNQGQVDYAMANEVLNKMARQQARLRPTCKVVSINWGPWDGGMVTSELKRNFVNSGIGLIPMDTGANAMVTEMSQPGDGPVEVVIGSGLPSASVTGSQNKPGFPH